MPKKTTKKKQADPAKEINKFFATIKKQNGRAKEIRREKRAEQNGKGAKGGR